ncbi:MAG TPA: hypothetical protein VG247_19775 [Pseudonocardiaceae bacterium]|nr:hypothetical protein [Pseudonocardiaceae bacterium]
MCGNHRFFVAPSREFGNTPFHWYPLAGRRALERLLAVNAAVGPVVGILAWLVALITISPIWQLPTT